MDKKDCFGSIKEITLKDGQTMVQAKPECRTCQEIRDCLRYSKKIEEEKKQKDEIRKQNMITQTIDLSLVLSNEIGSCLLEFLSRIYSNPLGMVLADNLVLFYEIPQNMLIHTLTIPISKFIIDFVRGEGDAGGPGRTSRDQPEKSSEEGFPLRIVLIQGSFPNKPKANMGLVAYEVARMFSSDDRLILQILQLLSDSERKRFKSLDLHGRTNWLIEKWGFVDEVEALKRERSRPTGT